MGEHQNFWCYDPYLYDYIFEPSKYFFKVKVPIKVENEEKYDLWLSSKESSWAEIYD